MRNLALRLVPGTALLLSGCAAPMLQPAEPAGELRLLTETVTSAPRVVLEAGIGAQSADQAAAEKRPVISLTVTESDEPSQDALPSSGPPMSVEPGFATAPRFEVEPSLDDLSDPIEKSPSDLTPPSAGPTFDPAMASDEPDAQQPTSTPPQVAPEPVIEFARQVPRVAGDAEEVVTPGPIPHSPFKPDVEESQDRVSRRVTDVPLDIRPTAGEMPDDLAAVKFAAEPTIDETWPSDAPADVFCSYTPWTICYRPLYFEDIRLERYGNSVGYLQSGLSGVRFFSSIAALPYKMTVRPPRSCQCSNGFSRPGDCPLPGYGHREFRWDASLVEAAAVAGVVYFLP